MNFDTFYSNQQWYTSDWLSMAHSLDEAIPERVTLYKTHLRGRRRRRLSRVSKVSPFVETELVPFIDCCEKDVFKMFSAPKAEQVEVSSRRFSRLVYKAFLEAIWTAWDFDKFHIVLHSSGYDSRLISVAVRELYRKHGHKRMGQVLFVECNGEGAQFKAIMKRQGWNESQYVVCNEGTEPGEYHANCFDFSTAWQKLNGISCYPFNLWWEPIERAQKAGLAPEDDDQIQCFTGYGANRSGFAMTENNVSRWFEGDYVLETGAWAKKVETIEPYYNLHFIKVLVENGLGKPAYYRDLVLQYIAPDTARIKHAKRPTRNRYNTISAKLLARCIRDYEQSWYANTVCPDVRPTPNIEYSMWWGAWCLASFCEHLLETGHSIEVEQ